MKRKFSIYHFLTAIMMFSLVLPGFAGATVQTPTGKLTIHKFEQEEGTNRGDGDGSKLEPEPTGTALPGVEYTLTQTHSYDPDNDEWTEVTGATPQKYTTGSDGKIVINNIELGRYTVQETGWPEHVNPDEREYSVDIPMTSKDGSSLNYDVHIYPKNETIRGAVELTKTDGDSGKALAGVQFELYNADGMKVEDKIFTTDPNGKIKVDGLAYGDYYFKEIATLDGYVLGSQKVEFSIIESGTTVEVDVKNYKKPDVDKEVDESAVNRGEVVTYTIAVDLPGDIKDYKNFVVTDPLHENLEYVDGSATSPNGFTFNYDEATRTLTWIATPSELSGPSTVEFTFKAKVSEDAPANKIINNKAYIDYENKHGSGGEKETDDVPVTPTAGNLKVIKQDKSTNEKLAGAEFELRDATGNVVETGTTGSNGELVFTSELDYGDYTLHETKAPNGYRKLTKPINVTINKDNHSAIVTVDNSKTGWELPKTGGIGTLLFTFIGMTLMGAALVMYIRRRKGEVA